MTPASKPRTECGCQPVAFIKPGIVAPASDRNMAIARDCFVSECSFLGRVGLLLAGLFFETAKGVLRPDGTLIYFSGNNTGQNAVYDTNTGTWTNTPTSFAYEWQRCDIDGANCLAVAGANGKTYGVRTVFHGFRHRDPLSVGGTFAPHHRSPISAVQPAGQDL